MSDGTDEGAPRFDRSGLLAQLRAELQSGETSEDEPEPSWSESYGHLCEKAPVATIVQRAVDDFFTAADVIDESVRRRLVATTDRALARRRHRIGFLEPMLLEGRKKRGLRSDDIAAVTGIAVEMVQDVERGRISLGDLLEEQIARWLLAAVDIDDARGALERSLATTGSPYGGWRSGPSKETTEFVQRVFDKVEHLRHSQARD